MTQISSLVGVAAILLLLFATTTSGQQIADPQFNTKVDNPAYAKNYPRVLFDEAHNNFDRVSGRYKPFADLIFNDGYHLAVNHQPFTKATLQTFKILIIVNPLGVEDVDEDGAEAPAFTSAECDAVNDWVRAGGALLLIADGTPFGSASENLAKRLGIDMSKSNTLDPEHAAKELDDPSFIVYSRENHFLAAHAITNGRSAAERVNRVIIFGGQSLKGPEGSEAFLKVADTAVAKIESPGKNESVAGRAQGIAFHLGKGRAVVLADAAMLSAQLTGSDNQPVGMNVPDIDNKQLALNIMHWLSGLLK